MADDTLFELANAAALQIALHHGFRDARFASETILAALRQAVSQQQPQSDQARTPGGGVSAVEWCDAMASMSPSSPRRLSPSQTSPPGTRIIRTRDADVERILLPWGFHPAARTAPVFYLAAMPSAGGALAVQLVTSSVLDAWRQQFDATGSRAWLPARSLTLYRLHQPQLEIHIDQWHTNKSTDPVSEQLSASLVWRSRHPPGHRTSTLQPDATRSAPTCWPPSMRRHSTPFATRSAPFTRASQRQPERGTENHMTDVSHRIESLSRVASKNIAQHYKLDDAATCLALVRAALRELAAEISGAMPLVAQSTTSAVAVSTAASPARSPSTGDEPRAPSHVVRFGRNAGTPVSQLTDYDARWYLNALERSLNDPEKARFREANAAIIDQVRAELARRTGAAIAHRRQDEQQRSGRTSCGASRLPGGRTLLHRSIRRRRRSGSGRAHSRWPIFHAAAPCPRPHRRRPVSMTTNPYAKLTASINGATPTTGGLTAALGATVQLGAVSTAGFYATRGRSTRGLRALRWAARAGDSRTPRRGRTTTRVPSSFRVTPWGKYMFRLSANGNPLMQNADGSPNTAFQQDLHDESTAISVLSPHGLHDTAFLRRTSSALRVRR